MAKRKLIEISEADLETNGEEIQIEYEETSECEELLSTALPETSSDVDQSNETPEPADSSLPLDDDSWLDVGQGDDSSQLAKLGFSVGNKKTGPQILADSCSEPIDYFQLLLSDDLLLLIVEQTNNHAKRLIQDKDMTKRSTWKSWRDVSLAEMKAFIAVILNMSIVRLPDIRDYWLQLHSCRVQFFSDVFRRERFFQVYWMVHTDETAGGFLDRIGAKLSQCFVPSQEVVVSDSMLKPLVRGSPKRAPCGRGIRRVYTLVDASTGYVHSFLPHESTGCGDDSSRIVLQLCQKLADALPEAQGFHVYPDKASATVDLGLELLKRRIYLTGPALRSQKHIPVAIRRSAVDSGGLVARRRGEVLLVAWRDDFVALSTYHTAELVTPCTRSQRDGEVVRQTPRVVLDYRRVIGSCEQHSAPYHIAKKAGKEPFFWVLEICSMNSYILHREVAKRQGKTPMTQLKFLRGLIEQLVGGFRAGLPADKARPTVSDEGRLDGKLHILRRNEKARSKECVVCSDRKNGQRRECAYHCSTCPKRPGLHIGDCFEIYHTKKVYR